MQELQTELEKLGISYEELGDQITSLQDGLCELEQQMSSLSAAPTGTACMLLQPRLRSAIASSHGCQKSESPGGF